MNNPLELFNYEFMVRALVAGILLALSAALVGVPLVLKRNSMLGDGLSHVGFAAFAVALALGLAPTWVAVPVVILVSFLILHLGQNAKTYSDAMIAMVSVGALAVGTFVASLSGASVDINSYLFGSILAVDMGEVWLAVGLAIVVVLIYVFWHHQIFAITFDEKFARSIGIRTRVYNMIFAILCSLVVVLGMRLMGALLISGLIVFPVLSAQAICRNFKGVLAMSTIIGVVTFVVGLVLSYVLAAPTGATVVLVGIAVYLVAKVAAKIAG